MHPYHRHYKSHCTTHVIKEPSKQIPPNFRPFSRWTWLGWVLSSSSSISSGTEPLAISGTGFFLGQMSFLSPDCVKSTEWNTKQWSNQLPSLSSFLHTPLDSIAPFIPARLDVSTKDINLEKVKKTGTQNGQDLKTQWSDSMWFRHSV